MDVNSIRHPSLAKSFFLIVSSYLLIDPRKIGGGIGEHYVELYGTFVKRYSEIYKIFWYSVRDGALYTFGSNGKIVNLQEMSMLMAILKVVTKARKSSRTIPPLTAIIAYYYAIENNVIGFLVSLLLFFFLRIMGLVNLILDVIDPPVEVHVTYNDRPSGKKIIFGTVLDILTLNTCTAMWTASRSYKKYLAKKYRIHHRKIHVNYHGSFPALIASSPPKAQGPLTVLYSGSMLKVKAVTRLIESIGRLREKNIKVNLLLTGGNLAIAGKPWIKSRMVRDWFKWISVLSSQADVCVIPYPRRVHWDLTHHCKLPDYMAAGKPVVSMYGKETAFILKTYNCGLVANDWDEFERHIIQLYKDRELAKKLGDNGREAVERIFNCEKRTQILHEIVSKYLKTK